DHLRRLVRVRFANVGEFPVPIAWGVERVTLPLPFVTVTSLLVPVRVATDQLPVAVLPTRSCPSVVAEPVPVPPFARERGVTERVRESAVRAAAVNGAFAESSARRDARPPPDSLNAANEEL